MSRHTSPPSATQKVARKRVTLQDARRAGKVAGKPPSAEDAAMTGATPLARAVSNVLQFFFGANGKTLFNPHRGTPKDVFFRQIATYLIHVEGDVPESEAAEIMVRDRSTVRHTAAIIEDERDDPDIDAAIRELGAAIVRLNAMSIAFHAATVELDTRAGRVAWIQGIKAAGKALRELAEGPPEAARVLWSPPDEALALLADERLGALLRGLRAVPAGHDEADLGHHVEVGGVEKDGRRTLRIVVKAARHVATDALHHGRAALAAAGMRIILSEVLAVPKQAGGGYAALFKVTDPRASNPRSANSPDNSSTMGR